MNSKQMKRALLYAARALGAFRLSRYLTRRQLRILCYHGFSVGDEYKSMPIMFMQAATFARRMNAVARMGVPVLSLDEAVDRLESNRIRNAETVITLDDGWVTNLTVAYPILKAHQFPATIYVTSEHLSNSTEVFNVVLSYLFLTCARDFVEITGVSPHIDGRYAVRPDHAASNEAIVQAVERNLTVAERQALLGKIAAAFGVDISTVLAGDRFRLLTSDEIRQLDRNGISIELHSHTHHLPADSFEATQKEISQNREAIKSITGKVAHHFCYPSGDYGTSHPEWLASLSIKSATTCDPGLNDATTNSLLLRRFLDGDDVSDIEFEAFISGFQHLLRRLLH